MPVVGETAQISLRPSAVAAETYHAGSGFLCQREHLDAAARARLQFACRGGVLRPVLACVHRDRDRSFPRRALGGVLRLFGGNKLDFPRHGRQRQIVLPPEPLGSDKRVVDARSPLVALFLLVSAADGVAHGDEPASPRRQHAVRHQHAEDISRYLLAAYDGDMRSRAKEFGAGGVNGIARERRERIARREFERFGAYVVFETDVVCHNSPHGAKAPTKKFYATAPALSIPRVDAQAGAACGKTKKAPARGAFFMRCHFPSP